MDALNEDYKEVAWVEEMDMDMAKAHAVFEDHDGYKPFGAMDFNGNDYEDETPSIGKASDNPGEGSGPAAIEPGGESYKKCSELMDSQSYAGDPIAQRTDAVIVAMKMPQANLVQLCVALKRNDDSAASKNKTRRFLVS